MGRHLVVHLKRPRRWWFATEVRADAAGVKIWRLYRFRSDDDRAAWVSSGMGRIQTYQWGTFHLRGMRRVRELGDTDATWSQGVQVEP